MKVMVSQASNASKPYLTSIFLSSSETSIVETWIGSSIHFPKHVLISRAWLSAWIIAMSRQMHCVVKQCCVRPVNAVKVVYNHAMYIC